MHDLYCCGVKQESDYLHHGCDGVGLDADSKFTKQDRMRGQKNRVHTPLVWECNFSGNRYSGCHSCPHTPDMSELSYFAIQIQSWFLKSQSKSNHSLKYFSNVKSKQACNQLGTPGGAKTFLRWAHIFWTMSNSFKQCPTRFPNGAKKNFASPLVTGLSPSPNEVQNIR